MTKEKIAKLEKAGFAWSLHCDQSKHAARAHPHYAGPYYHYPPGPYHPRHGLLDNHGRAVSGPGGHAPSPPHHRRVHHHYHPYNRYPPPHGHPVPYCHRDEEGEGAEEERMLVAGGPGEHADETPARKRSCSTRADDHLSFSAGSTPPEGHPQPHRRKKVRHSPGMFTVGDNASDKQGEFFAIDRFPLQRDYLCASTT